MKVGDCELIPHCEISEDTVAEDAAKQLKKHQERHCFVTIKGVPQGVIGAVDLAYKLVAEGKDPKTTKVVDLMVKPLHACITGDKISDVYLKMAKNNLVSMPVLENDKIKGLITAQELMKHFVKMGSENES